MNDIRAVFDVKERMPERLGYPDKLTTSGIPVSMFQQYQLNGKKDRTTGKKDSYHGFARIDEFGAPGTSELSDGRQKWISAAGRNNGKRWKAMREKTIELKLIQAVKGMRGIAPKFTSPGYVGVPDRLVLLPGGHMAFVEVKAPGMQLRPLQVKQKRQLEALGFSVYCIDHPDQIGGVLDEIRTS
jgi:hypothetical protein